VESIQQHLAQRLETARVQAVPGAGGSNIMRDTGPSSHLAAEPQNERSLRQRTGTKWSMRRFGRACAHALTSRARCSPDPSRRWLKSTYRRSDLLMES
jgi:hypothetical protein